jgi:hypothetical protein
MGTGKTLCSCAAFDLKFLRLSPQQPLQELQIGALVLFSDC